MIGMHERATVIANSVFLPGQITGDDMTTC